MIVFIKFKLENFILNTLKSRQKKNIQSESISCKKIDYYNFKILKVK